MAVGRLVPVKRFHLLIDALVRLKPRLPDLRAVIAGEGYERADLEELIRRHGAEDWISLPGFVSQDELVDLYRRAWVVASSSLREGWGMTVTEAGACGTPSVVSRISGHQDAVADGESGILVDDQDGMVEGLHSVLADEVLRKRLSLGAADFAARFSWESTARQTVAVLAAEKIRRDKTGDVVPASFPTDRSHPPAMLVDECPRVVRRRWCRCVGRAAAAVSSPAWTSCPGLRKAIQPAATKATMATSAAAAPPFR